MDASSVELPSIRARLIRFLLWVCAYLAIAVALVGANPFKGETTGPFDLLASYPGWNSGEPVTVRNPERSDIIDALVPAWMESRRQLREGHFPFWNPLQAGGRPGLLDPTTGEMTVGFALFAAAPDPALGFYLAVLSSLVIAGLGMHLLVARTYSRWAALFAGVSYMACGFLTAWLFWPQTYTAIWVPWLMLATWRYAEAGSPLGFVGIAAATALMFLGGFPFVVALGIGAALVMAFFAVRTLRGRALPLRRLGGTMVAMALGIGVVAVPLFVFVGTIGSAELSYRSGGSGLTWLDHRMLLSLPWAARSPHVESNMYIGMAGLLFAFLGLARLVRTRGGALLWTAAGLTVVGIVLTFGVLPMAIGKHLFVLSNNPWNRAILLLDMGLILMAAAGIDALLKRIRPRPVLLVAGVLLCSVQGYDLGRQFRLFNGPTPSRYFYAAGPKVVELQRHIRPLEYVAQDSRYFMVSGTLGAVGLGEWFAHSLRSPQLRNLLDALADKPFTTPTATAIGIEGFDLDSDLADTVALCYAVFPTSAGGSPVVATPQGKQTVALAPINNLTVTQRISLPGTQRVSAVALRLATYQDPSVDGTVTMRLSDAVNGREVARSSLPGDTIRDNEMAPFRLEGQPTLAAGFYDVELTYVPGVNAKRLTVWMLADAAGEVRRGDQTLPGSLMYSVLGREDETMKVVSEGQGVTSARNGGCSHGPYRASDLTKVWSTRTPGAALLVRYLPHDFEIASSAAVPGFVVVPMQYQRGWSALVDGRPTSIRLVKGVLPAVAVPAGDSRVSLVYRPPRWFMGWAISAISLLLLAGLAWRMAMVRRRGTAVSP